MKTNAVTDEIRIYLESKHTRVYQNGAPATITVGGVKVPTPFPYIVFRNESVTNSYPSEDLYLNIDIYEDSDASVRTIEDLADSIDKNLNLKVINTDILNLHFDREQRQYIEANELVSAQAINIRYVVRAYFK